jgi:hypothetical protein
MRIGSWLLLAACVSAPLSAHALNVEVTYAPAAVKAFEKEYGTREMDYLSGEIVSRLNKALEGSDVARVAVTVLEAVPGRPTMFQMREEPTLSLQSFGLGGAKVEGVLFAADGSELGRVSHSYREYSIEMAQYGTTWGDARQAFDGFAKKAGKLADG